MGVVCTSPAIPSVRPPFLHLVEFVLSMLKTASVEESSSILFQSPLSPSRRMIIIQVLEKRGLLINKEKSRLVPGQSFQWLGFMWDILSGMMSLPQGKVESFSKDLQSFLDEAFVLRRQMERVLGRLQLLPL